MNDTWRPDWRDPSRYPDYERTGDASWAWEFLRRNKDYREACAKLKDVDLANASPEIKDLYDDACARFSVSRLRDPAKNIGKYLERDSPDFIFSRPTKIWAPGLNEFAPKRSYEVGVMFDLRYPIALQVDYAKEQLEALFKFITQPPDFSAIHPSMQKAIPVEPYRMVRAHRDNFVTYLRLLDWKDENPDASLSTVVEIFDPASTLANSERQREKRLTYDLKIASQLSESGYLFLAQEGLLSRNVNRSKKRKMSAKRKKPARKN